MELMETLIEIVKEIKPGVNLVGEKNLVESGLLDSFEVIELVSEIGDKLQVDIPVEDIIPENFESLEAIERIVRRQMEI